MTTEKHFSKQPSVNKTEKVINKQHKHQTNTS